MSALPATMTCVEIKKPGGPEALVPTTRPVPQPKDGELLIKVAATGVNRPDIAQRAGLYPPPPGASDLPGLEAAGTVAALGAGVSGWKVGDAVCALTPGGSYAEYCTAPAQRGPNCFAPLLSRKSCCKTAEIRPSPCSTRSATSASPLVKPKSLLSSVFGGSDSSSGSMIITKALAAVGAHRNGCTWRDWIRRTLPCTADGQGGNAAMASGCRQLAHPWPLSGGRAGISIGREFLTLPPGNSATRGRPLPRRVLRTRNARRSTQKMTTTKILKSWLFAALLAAATAHAADKSPIQVAMEDGKTIAQFKIGDSSCTLIDGQIRCTLSTK